MGETKDAVISTVQSLRWTLSAFLLSKVGSSRHEISILTEPDGPARAPFLKSELDEHAGQFFLRRSINFGRIGILCYSDTRPCVRELVLGATIHENSALMFGPSTKISEGFGDTEFGVGKVYRIRVDWTNLTSDSEEAKLLVLDKGKVAYPLRYASTGIHLPEIEQAYMDKMSSVGLNLSDIEDVHYRTAEETYNTLHSAISLELGMILDSDELLLFRWQPENQAFSQDPFTLGIRPK